MQQRLSVLASLGLAVFALAAVSCGDKSSSVDAGEGSAGTGSVEEVDPDGPWAKIYDEVIVPGGCDNTFCHGNAAELNLSLDLGYEQLVGVPAKGVDCKNKTTKKRVEPGDPDASLLVEKVEGPACGMRMPINLPKLEPAQLQLIRDWIEDGAKKN